MTKGSSDTRQRLLRNGGRPLREERQQAIRVMQGHRLASAGNLAPTHQIQALKYSNVPWRSNFHDGICVDEMGLGKTIFALESLDFFRRHAAAHHLTASVNTTDTTDSDDDVADKSPSVAVDRSLRTFL